MAFDFKKEYRELYLPKTDPAIVEVPRASYLAVRGKGDPNQEDGPYKRAVGLLYTMAYTIKMCEKGGRSIPGFFPYVVPPLEGFWEQEGGGEIDLSHKAGLCWTSVIRLPDFVTPADLQWAKEEAARKKKPDCSPVELLTVEEGTCVQILHLGPYDGEGASIARMTRFAEEQGWVTDLSPARLHHEIYLSDPRKSPPEKWKTVIRLPVRKA